MPRKTQLVVVTGASRTVRNTVGSSKSDNFKRLAEQRVAQVFEAMRKLENLSNRYSYEFTEEQVDHIYRSIAQEVVKGRKRFSPNHKKFSFSDI